MKTFVVRILASTLFLAALAGCAANAGVGASSSSSDFPYANGEAASHNSAL